MDPFTLHAQINVIEKKNRFWPEKSRYQGLKCPVTQEACFHDLHKILYNFFVIIRYKECQKN